jgi:hypothetical protein
MSAFDFEVARKDLRQCRIAEAAVPQIQDGQVLLRIERFALTANNVTYGVFGDSMQYWQFFPAAEGWGRIPAWGFARVERSRCEGLAEGERVYGYLPMSSHLVVQPGRIGETSFMDATPHRRALPAAYQLYRRVSKDAAHDPGQEDEQALLSPLYITSFLIEDFLADNELFGARSVIIASASSKTALGVAQRLSQNRPQSCEVIGLTSARNRSFCEQLGHYDRVVTYDALEALPADVPSVYVDMSGGDSLSGVHHRFGDALRHSCLVGFTHWEEHRPMPQLPGPKPQFFFAPGQIKKRTQDWGPGGIDQRFAVAWAEFLPLLRRWLRVRPSTPAQWAAAWDEIVEGRTAPQTGHILEA